MYDITNKWIFHQFFEMIQNKLFFQSMFAFRKYGPHAWMKMRQTYVNLFIFNSVVNTSCSLVLFGTFVTVFKENTKELLTLWCYVLDMESVLGKQFFKFNFDYFTIGWISELSKNSEFQGQEWSLSVRCCEQFILDQILITLVKWLVS